MTKERIPVNPEFIEKIGIAMQHRSESDETIKNVILALNEILAGEERPSGKPTTEDLENWKRPDFAAWYSHYAHWGSKEEAYAAWLAASG